MVIADFTWTDLPVALVVALVGAVAGWLLNKGTAKEEREHQQRLRVREIEVEAARAMYDALERIGLRLPAVGEPDSAEPYWDALEEWERGWGWSSMLTDDDLLDRYWAVRTMLWMAHRFAPASHQCRPGLRRAVVDAQRALTAFRREEPLPPRTFPTTMELLELVPERAGGGVRSLVQGGRRLRICVGCRGGPGMAT
jgi:hypothetical protein